MLAQGLYIVATPIGNLADISDRARLVLEKADTVVCEDTRHTGRLLQKLGLRKKLRSYHDHSDEGDRASIIDQLLQGQTLALVSDAGTPCIADPGFKLVRDAVAAGIAVSAVPGANAALTAMAISGLPTDRFLFEGFLPVKSAARRQRLEKIRAIDATLVFYETPQRLARSLADMFAVLGERQAVIARELTKMYEETQRGSLSELAQRHENADPLKGELVIVVEGMPDDLAPSLDPQTLDQLILDRMPDLPPKQVARDVAAMTGLKTKEVYDRLLVLKQSDPRSTD